TGAEQGAVRVLPRSSRTEVGKGQVGHRGVVHRPSGLDVGHDAELLEPGEVGGVHQLEVGQLVAQSGGTVAPAGPLQGVEDVSDSAVTDGVEVQLETRGVQLLHCSVQQLCV